MKEYESMNVSASTITKVIKEHNKQGWRVKEKMPSEDGKKIFIVFERNVR